MQGVGFRPFVYRLARRYLVSGWVLNDMDGVFIHAEAESGLLDEFVAELHTNPPAAAKISEVELREVPLADCVGFEIRESAREAPDEPTLVSADLATCDDCLRELFDPADRRYRYPFINCTNCGPRFTIIDELPYDRPKTSMASFEMCGECAREYADPADRRFHAQPDACFECGPHLTWAWLAAEAGSAAVGGAVAHEVPAAGAGAGAARAGAVRTGAADMTADAVEVDVARGPGMPEALSRPTGEPGAIRVAEGRAATDEVLARAAHLLCGGGILAVKGLGGFHLACDAADERAIARLRAGKRRDGKAFAVMVETPDAARELCEVSEAEEALLRSPARPIVLLRKRAGAALAAGLADALPELGVMLPATPVQHLLIRGFNETGGCGMLVMTSGNVHDEPIAVDDAEACAKLGGIADALLGNDRPILSRYDDSVVRVVELGGRNAYGEPNLAVQFIRRARGYAPVPLPFKVGGDAQAGASPPGADAVGADGGAVAAAGGAERVHPAGGDAPSPTATGAARPAGGERPTRPVVLACGSEQKNTFTFVRGQEAYVSQHIGDMENADVFDAWLDSKARFEKLFGLAPQVYACDAHPDYLASKWAHAQSFRDGLPLTAVQHHHAHIASVLGEHGLYGPAIGVAFDGTGYGADGAIWGGEVLLANQVDYERFANFAYVPMPGGAAAIRNPLRMAYGMLWAYDLLEHPGACEALEALGDQAPICEQMVESGLNTPMTSSVGRLFDAVSALLGICRQPTYEGEAAILLDAARAADLGPAAEGPRMAWGEATGRGVLRAPGTRHERPRGLGGSPDELPAPQNPESISRGEGDWAANAERYGITFTKNAATDTSTAHDTSVVLLDAENTLRAVLDDMAAGVAPGIISARFHDAVVDAVVQVAELARAMYDISLVALSGGCFMNRYLVEQSAKRLGAAGFTVALNANLPPNDGCVSFGQAVVAAASR